MNTNTNLESGVDRLTFKAKINGTVIAVFALLLIASAYATYSVQSNQLEKSLNKNAVRDVEVFQAQIRSDADGLKRALAGLTQLEPFLKNLKEQNREALLAAAAPVFSKLKQDNNITHTYFFDTNGVTFLRAHNPKQFGDQNKRNSFKLARESGKTGVSLDMGKNFFSLRAVTPVTYNGEHIGYMEVAQEIDHLFKLTHDITGDHVSALLSQDYQKTLGTELKGSTVSGYTLLESTESDAALKLATDLGSKLGSDNNFSGFLNNYFVSIAPLKDGSGNLAGVLMFHHDVSGDRSAMWSKIIETFLIQAAVLVLGLIALAMVIRSTLAILGGDPAYARKITNEIASGNLSIDIDTETKDRNSLLYSMKNMRDRLTEVMQGIAGVSLNISAATDDIAAGNTSLSQRTEEQASSLEETASSMEEMTGTVKQNADSAAQAKQMADANRMRAAAGAEVVNRTVNAMGEINASSTRIADIISTIDGIAFQTNLLALNAAVEAARAGDQGRGFAVVASEVRSLAQRSADAAKEIKGLIEDSVGKVKAGTQLVDESGKTLEDIIEGTQKMADIVAEIAAASIEQASGIDQVNNAISQMDNMTQENAALVEEAAASSRSMQEQVVGLNEMISFFRIDTSNRLGTDRASRALESGSFAKRSPNRGPSTPGTSSRATLKAPADRVRASDHKPSEWEQF